MAGREAGRVAVMILVRSHIYLPVHAGGQDGAASIAQRSA